MPDQPVPFLKEILNVVTFSMISVVTFLGWSMKRQVVKYTDKVDDHEKNHINKDDFNKTLEALRRDFKEMRTEIKADVSDIRNRLDRRD